MALKRDIEVDDLPIVPDYSRGKLWNIKLNRHRKSSTFWTLMSLAKYELLFVIFCSILIGGLKVRRFFFDMMICGSQWSMLKPRHSCSLFGRFP